MNDGWEEKLMDLGDHWIKQALMMSYEDNNGCGIEADPVEDEDCAEENDSEESGLMTLENMLTSAWTD